MEQKKLKTQSDRDRKRKVEMYLFENTVNTSSRTTSTPKDYPDIINNGKKISNIAIDQNVLYNQLTIRVKFVGSEKFFALGVENSLLTNWINAWKLFIIENPLYTLGIFDEEKEVVVESTGDDYEDEENEYEEDDGVFNT
jgi:hypothetical protein